MLYLIPKPVVAAVAGVANSVWGVLCAFVSLLHDFYECRGLVTLTWNFSARLVAVKSHLLCSCVRIAVSRGSRFVSLSFIVLFDCWYLQSFTVLRLTASIIGTSGANIGYIRVSGKPTCCKKPSASRTLATLGQNALFIFR